MSSPALHIACSTDRYFAPDCAVMLASLVATNAGRPLTVHFLHDASLPADDVEALGAVVTGGGGAAFQAIDLTGSRAGELARSERFPSQAWYRVLLPELLPDLPRVLYLDADTLVVDSLTSLWELDLQGHLLGAVTNPLLDSMVPRIQQDLGLPGGDSYFNSGVLLIDLDAWRTEGVAEAIIEFAQSHPASPWPDQDALNGVLHGRRLHLHPRWNAMPGLWNVPRRYLPHTEEEVREAKRNPAIVHFVGPHKPWHYRNRHPYRDTYFAYLAQTPWRGRSMEGRSLWQAVLRPLPWLWAYHLEVGAEGARRWLVEARGRVRLRSRLRSLLRSSSGPRSGSGPGSRSDGR